MAEALTFEKVWTMFQETSREIKEMSQETDRIIREMSRETDRKMQETDRKIGELGNRFGELAEHLVTPNIVEKFNALNFNFEQISQDIKIKDSSGNCLAEIDILLENGDIVIAVEVKAKPLEKDVDKHIERMEFLRRRADTRKDMRKFRGAIAGAIISEGVRNYSFKAGLYVIEQTGDTVKINIPEGFVPKEW